MSGMHDEMVVLAPAYVLGALEPDERRAFETHLAECDRCVSEVRSLGRVTSGLAQTVPQVTPRAALRDRVLRAVGAPDARVAQPDVRAGWAIGNWLAYAACVAVATAAVLYAINLRARVESLEARLEVAQLRLAAERSRAGPDATSRVRDAVGDGGAHGGRSDARRSAGCARCAARGGPRDVEPSERDGVRGESICRRCQPARSIRCGSWPAVRR